jgi:hypothetical protein
VNGRICVHWDDAEPSGLPYVRTYVVPCGGQAGGIATAAVDEGNRRVTFSTALGETLVAQQPTVHALAMDTGAILWENTAEASADGSCVDQRDPASCSGGGATPFASLLRCGHRDQDRACR